MSAMIIPGQAHTVRPGEGPSVELGVVTMRVLMGSDDVPANGFTLTEFSGGEGAWTVPHLHREMEESFFVLDGTFTFSVGTQRHQATPGAYLLVPRGTAHAISAGANGGRLLVLMVPGGLEHMFFELGTLPPNAIRDPEIRAAISARYDSVPT
jgi:quercetin dioxygenase-like cupin family protein